MFASEIQKVPTSGYYYYYTKMQQMLLVERSKVNLRSVYWDGENIGKEKWMLERETSILPKK